MYKILIETLIETLKIIPLLLVIYLAIELLEYKYGNILRQKMQKIGNLGPILGALFGSFPQCGTSVIVTTLYTERLTTMGTLIAVYLATSDEAVPVLLSEPNKINIVLLLIITKIVIAIISGYGIDFIYRKNNNKIFEHIDAYSQGRDDNSHHHEATIKIKACCNHIPFSPIKKLNLLHPIKHTLKILIFVFCASFIINILISKIGEIGIQKFFMTNSFFQPILTALFGLIPNCVVSVVIAKLYLKNIISFGSVLSGLSVGAGLGLLVLFRQEKNKKNVFKIIFLLLLLGISAGFIADLNIKLSILKVFCLA